MPVKLRLVLADYFLENDLSAATEKSYGVVVNVFERWLCRPATISDLAEHVNDYLRFRLAGGKIAGAPVRGNRSTARAHKAVLALLLRHAAKHRWIRRPRVRRIRKTRMVPYALLLTEIKRLLAHASPRQRAAIRLAYDTGFRKGDVFAATWAQVYQRGGETLITRVICKTGRIETRRLRPATVADLQAIREPGDDKLIPGGRNKSNWNIRWHRLGHRAGVDVARRGLQAVRRSGASYVEAKGGSAKKYLGHATDGLAERHYIDPRIAGEIPDLPPPIDGHE